MRMTLFLAAAAAAFSVTAGNSSPGFTLPQNFDPWNVNYNYSIDQLNEAPRAMGVTPQAAPQKKPALKAIKKEPEFKQTYFIAAQTFHKNYVFNYDGGAVRTYEIEVAIDGDKATISNFFDLAAQSTEYMTGVDIDVVGAYDAEAKTITIPTSTLFDDATIAGTIGENMYTELLVCGTVDANGQLAADPELVLYLDEDMKHIYSKQSIGAMHWYTPVGMSFGMQYIYRIFEGFAPSSEPRILSYNSIFDMGQTYADTEVSVSTTYVNVSDSPIDYAITIESDGNAFTADPGAGEVESRSAFEVAYTFHPMTTGDFEGIATLNYEGGSSTPAPIVTLLNGSAIDYPDYSAIVKEGDMTFTTNIEYPFAIAQNEKGTTVARSTVNGFSGSSRLTVSFEVPEGQIGTFSWKGKSFNKADWYKNAAGYFIDDAANANVSWNGSEDDISGSVLFTPGKHSLRFQYDCMYYSGDESNHMYVYDLALDCVEAEPDAAEVLTEEVSIGSYVIKPENPTAQGNGVIRMRNLGRNQLEIKSVTSDNDKFSGTAPSSTVGLLESIEIPVQFASSEAGTFEGNLTIRTSAGDFTAKATALVRQLADFTPLVTEGKELVTAITTNESSPFDMKDGTAYNANAGLADTQWCDSWVKIEFEVPEGKAVRLEWDAHNYGGVNPDADPAWQGTDYGMIEYSHPMLSGSRTYYDYDSDAGSQSFANDPSWADALVCVPGKHYLTFHYIKIGDNFISEEDRFEVSNLKLKLEDFPEYGCTPNVEEVVFTPTYVGPNRYTTATIDLRNTGSQILKVTGSRTIGDAPFYGTFSEGNQCNWNQDIQVGIWFYPGEEGQFEGDVVFETTAGDVTIHCVGETKPAEGILLVGDVEDAAYGWMTYDADMDGSCWNLGTNLWGERPEWVHGGVQCFASPSAGTYGEALVPDNWAISPVFTMPEDGKAMLEYYVAAHHSTKYAEHYSVYMATDEEAADPDNLVSLNPLVSETLTADDAVEFRKVTVELEGTPGTGYRVLFRHHDCTGEYVLKLDDIFVYTVAQWNKNNSSVEGIFSDADIVSTEIHDINGMRLSAPVEGFNLVTVEYADGRRVTRKVFVTE